MKVLIKTKISDHKYKDSHGYLICTDCIMARTGKQTYTRDDCFNDGDYTEIEVDRSEKEVFDSKALASFENVPVTIEHPDNNVDPDNYSSLSVGYVRDIKKGTYEGKPVMKGTIVLTDSDAIEKVESGELTNLSCGYNCDVVDCDQPYQANIRGNHLALCEIPRAGITHICDSKKIKDSKVKITLPTDVFNDNFTYVDEEEEEPDIEWLQTRYNVDIDKHDYETYVSGEEEDVIKFMNDHIWYWDDKYDLGSIDDSIEPKIQKKLTRLQEKYLNEIKKYNYNFDEAFQAYLDDYKNLSENKADEVLKKVFNRGVYDSKTQKVKDINEGYAIVPEKRYKKFGINSKIERWIDDEEEAVRVAKSIERNDNIKVVIINCNEEDKNNKKESYKYDKDYSFEENDDERTYYREESENDSLEKAKRKFRRGNK